MRITRAFLLLVAVALAIYLSMDINAIALWAAEQQRSFQNQMAGAVRLLKAGDPGAYSALLGATLAYGFVHALGPGHGKYLIGGVGLGTSVPAVRLLGIAMISSLAQALWAILLVFGGFALLQATASQVTFLAESVLAPVSYLAIASVGLILIWRGLHAIVQPKAPAHSHSECSCHAHGPDPSEVAAVQSVRDVVVLVASIAVRPCTGAVFMPVIAWQMDIKLAGAVAVIVMGLGTAALTSLVAVSSIAARSAVGPIRAGLFYLSSAQVIAGAVILLSSLSLLGFAT